MYYLFNSLVARHQFLHWYLHTETNLFFSFVLFWLIYFSVISLLIFPVQSFWLSVFYLFLPLFHTFLFSIKIVLGFFFRSLIWLFGLFCIWKWVYSSWALVLFVCDFVNSEHYAIFCVNLFHFTYFRQDSYLVCYFTFWTIHQKIMQIHKKLVFPLPIWTVMPNNILP